jgi:hypothetical protein
MNPERDKPSMRARLTGIAQPVTNSVARAHEYFKGHPEPTASPAKVLRKNFRAKRSEIGVEEPPAEPESSGDEEDHD